MKVGLTGASGLLGGNLVRVLRDAGHTPVCTRRGSSRVGHLDALEPVWVDADLGDADALARAFDGCERVVHCAASTSVLPRATPALWSANVDGTGWVLKACEWAGVTRLVHVSSTVAVGVSDDGTPCTEGSAWNLREHGLADGYAVTKRAAEGLVDLAVEAGSVDAVIVNPAFLFGPYDARPSSGRMILEVAAGRARFATPGRNCFVDARRVAEGVWLAAERGATGRRYILGGENLTYGEAFARIATVVGASPPALQVPRALAAPLGWAGDLVQALTGREQAVTSTTLAWGYHPGFVMDSGRARAELGWDPGSLDDGIRAAWDWFRTEGRT